MTHDSSCLVSLFAFVRDQVGGVLSSAAVPRCGLGPLPPPLCRCAKYTADLNLLAWRVFCRYRDLIPPAWRVVHRDITVSTSTACLPLGPTHPHRCPCAWFGRRSGIKEEQSAPGRRGGQPRSRPSQAHGRTHTPAAQGPVVQAQAGRLSMPEIRLKPMQTQHP